MKKITLQIGLTMAMLVLAGTVYSQTANTVNLDSNGSTTAPVPDEGSALAQDDTILTIDAVTGAVTVNALDPDYLLGASTGAINFSDTFGLTFDVRLKVGMVVDQTLGSTYGSITTTGGIDRSSTGDIGVRPPTGTASYGIDNGEGVTFGFKLTNLPSTVTLQVTKISFTTFSTTGETAVIVNRRNTSKFINVLQSNGSNPTVDVSGLDLFVRGSSTIYDLVSIFNDANPQTNPQAWRIGAIEFQLVDATTIPTVWYGTAWSNGTPGPNLDAIIEGNYSASATGGFSAKTLTVNSGSLTIEATKNLKVENGVVNNAGPSGIVVEDGGTLQQVQAGGVNSGEITVKKNSNSLKRLDYTMWSSPVVGSQTLASFSPLTSQSPNRFYTYDPASDLYVNATPTEPFSTATGYLIRMPNENPAELGTSSDYFLGNSAITFNGEFVGVPNNGTITLGSTIPLTSDKYYAVGNPYPSNLSADLFIDGNVTDGTLYYWRKTNAALGTAYATYTKIGATITADPGNGGITPTNVIAPCQGFIVKTGLETTSLTFTNAMRLNNTTYGTFFKTKQEASKDRVWLNLTNATGAFSQALVGYMDGATVGVDNGLDGKYINDSPIALTSSINEEEYTIQARPAFDATDVVVLNFKTDVAGDYSIALDHFDGVFATGQAVYLVDSKIGTETDLKAGAYNFTAAAGVDNARFSLKYQKTLKVIDSEFNDNNITVYGNNGSLFVKSAVSAIQNIKVFDIQGRLIAEQKNVKSNTAALANLKTQQTLIVQVSTEDNKVVSKKVVK
jgi:hypothetical protein